MAGTCSYTIGPEGAEAAVDSDWQCPHEPAENADRCVFHLSPSERDARGVENEDVTEALLAAVAEPGRDAKSFIGATLERLRLDYRVIESADRFPVDLRGATIESLSFEHAEVEVPIHLDGATIDDLRLSNAEFAEALHLSGAALGTVDAFETVVRGDARFDDATFADDAQFVETTFADDVWFDRASFEAGADFSGSEYYGAANLLADNATFTDATFAGPAQFDHAAFEHTGFAGVTFATDVSFERAVIDGNVTFEGAVFKAGAAFDEVTFDGDATFEDVAFEGSTTFQGIAARGGSAVLADDLTFEGSRFAEGVDFQGATIAMGSFERVAFDGQARFEEATFTEDVEFSGAAFAGEADFDETRYQGDADFREVTFEGLAVFRGSEFTGEANHLEDNVDFDGATFVGRAEFDSCEFTAGSFEEVVFHEFADFSGSTFDRLDISATAPGEAGYVDLTDTHLMEGSITQPEEGWVRYDLTYATVGDVSLSGAGAVAKDLLDYFRFCETRFEGFDFTAHRAYLERNDWSLHRFDAVPGDQDPYDLELTPATIETTYLLAGNAARAQGARDAAVEFAIKKALFRRRKNLAYVRDGSITPGTRLRKAGEVAGNFAWHQVCGYGYRLWRILATSVLVIVVWGFLFAFLSDPESGSAADAGTTTQGLSSLDQLTTGEGIGILFDHMYYSLITFTTVGYGDINPLGPTGRTLAATEGALGVLLASLVVFVLGRRVAL